MLVSHRRKFIYTKTAKTAGTSIESYFEPYCMEEGTWEFTHHRDQHVCSDGIVGSRGPEAEKSEWYNHMSAAGIKEKVGSENWNRYFKFCAIRNPFDKLVSLFFFQKSKGLLGGDKDCNPVDGFRKWIARGVPAPDRQQYMINGKVCVDYFIRYEKIAEGIEFVCNKLDIDFMPECIPKLKSGIRDHSIPLTDFYTPEISRMVIDAHEFEIKEFKYDLMG